MHEEKSHDWEEIYANCDFGLSSEPRAKDVRRKPILAEREREERKGMKEWVNARRMQQRTTSERDGVKWVERRGVNVLKKLLKKVKKLYRESRPPCLPGGPHICIVKSRLVNDKIRKSESLRGEIIRPVCKCKLLRNFLPSPPFRARYFWQIFRERECGIVSANVREDGRQRNIYTCAWESEVTCDTCDERTERSRQKEKKEPSDKWSSTVRLRDIEEKRNRVAGKTRTTIENGRYHKCHYPSNPSATESMRNKECRNNESWPNPAWQKIGLFWSAFASTRYMLFSYIYIYGFVLYILLNRSQYARSIPMLISYLSSNGFSTNAWSSFETSINVPYLMGNISSYRLRFLSRPCVARESREWKIARTREWRKGTRVWIVCTRVPREAHTKWEWEHVMPVFLEYITCAYVSTSSRV